MKFDSQDEAGGGKDHQRLNTQLTKLKEDCRRLRKNLSSKRRLRHLPGSNDSMSLSLDFVKLLAIFTKYKVQSLQGDLINLTFH